MNSPSSVRSQELEWLKESRGKTITTGCILLWTLSTVFVVLRLYTRRQILRRVQLDDYLIIIATLLGWANVGTVIAGVQHGLGRHTISLTLQKQGDAKFYAMLSFVFGILSISLPKLAVASLLARLLSPSKCHLFFLWALALLCITTALVTSIILFTQCSPPEYIWGKAPEGKCIDTWILIHYYIFVAALSAFTDLYLAIYPAVVLWGLQLNFRKKIAVSIALSIGSISCIIATYKITRIPSLASQDYNYDTVDLIIWTAAEATSTVIACCIPILKPLVDGLFGWTILNDSSRNNYKPRSNQSGETGLSKISCSSVQHTYMSHSTTVSSYAADLEPGFEESALRKDSNGIDAPKQQTRGLQIRRTDSVRVTFDERETTQNQQSNSDVAPF